MRNRLWTLLLCIGVACSGSNKNGGMPDDAGGIMSDGSLSGDGDPSGDGDGEPGGDGDGDGDGGAGDGDGGKARFACRGMDTIAVSSQVANTLHVEGVMVGSGATLALRSLDVDDAGLTLTAVEVQAGQLAVFDLAAGALDAGLYAVDLQSGDAVSPCGTIGVTDLPPPTVTKVTPDSAGFGVPDDGFMSDRTVVIEGTGFQDAPSVLLVKRGDAKQRFLAEQVSFLSTTQITAVVPAESLGMPVGEYDVFVINPDGLRGTWADPFRILADPPPQITEIDPVRGAKSPSNDPLKSPPITITGKNFNANATVAIDVNGVLKPLVVDAATRTSTSLVVPPINGNDLGLVIGVQYPIRVTNPDGQYDVYFAYSVSASSDAKLTSFAETPDVRLAVGRFRLASVVGFDATARGFIYVGGGIDASSNVLGSVEQVEVSNLGQHASGAILQQWGDSATPRVNNGFVTPRAGHSMVRVGRYLYALGGASSNTHVATPDDASLLASVERAKILDYQEQPAMFMPRVLGGSGLPLGNWYYRVSALGEWGESLPSREVQLLQTGGSVRVCWGSVPGATGYNIYRSPASDGRAGTTRLLAKEVVGSMENGDVRCTTDDGHGAYQFAPGRLRGTAKADSDTGAAGPGLAVGNYVYRVTAVVDGLETSAGYRSAAHVESEAADHIVVRWDPVVGATYNLYRTQGALAGDPVGNETTYLIAGGLTSNEWTDAGASAVDTNVSAPDGFRGLTPGSLTRFKTLPVAMPEPREGLDALSVTLPRVERPADGDAAVVGLSTYIYAAGGRSATTANTDEVYLSTVLRVEVDVATGDLIDDFVDAGGSMQEKRAFFPLLTNIGQRSSDRAPPPEEPPCRENDGDGHLPLRCGGLDCDDNDPQIHPGAIDPCGDGVDQDCDGKDPVCEDDTCPRDRDGDGVLPIACGGCDCDDGNPAIHCGAVDVCDDGVDQDCQGGDSSCASCVDEDMDGQLSLGCGGCDCNDGDKTIACGLVETCEATPELCDDGIDQDCSGEDCHCAIILFAADATSDLASYDPDQSALLIAVAGDNTYDAGSNAGLGSFEVTGLSTVNDETHGDVLGWALQNEGFSAGQLTMGHDALLYFDYLFPFYGVQTENRATASISPRGGSSGRWTFTESPADEDAYLVKYESTSTAFTTSRAYYTLQRINGGVFGLGGHDGTNVLNSIQRTIP